MAAILKATGGPGSIPFLVLCIALGLAALYFWPRRRRLAVMWLAVVVGAYALLALPAVAHAIADRLPTPAGADARDGSPIAALIILDGDNRRGRVREAQRVIASDRPQVVWVLGNRWILEALAEAGIPRTAFQLDSRAGTTRLQMAQVAEMSRRLAPGRVAVIASRLQAPRVAALAQALGITVTVQPAPIDVEPPTAGLAQFVPTYTALRVSRDALYEHAALFWYQHNGWIALNRARASAAAAAPVPR